jgi:hypothetical protein
LILGLLGVAIYVLVKKLKKWKQLLN